jgi:hypothetical protein
VHRSIDVDLLGRIQAKAKELSHDNPEWTRLRMIELAQDLSCSKIAVGVMFELACRNKQATKQNWRSNKKGYIIFARNSQSVTKMLTPKNGGKFEVRQTVLTIRGAFDADDIVERVNMHKPNVYKVLQLLVEEGILLRLPTKPISWQVIQK